MKLRFSTTLSRAVLGLLGVLVLLAVPATGRADDFPSITDSAWDLARRTDPDSLIARAERAVADGRPGDAARHFEKAASLDPRRRAKLTALAAYQFAWAGRLDRAEDALLRARQSNPRDYDLRMAQIMIENWMGDHLDAWRHYRLMSDEHPAKAGPWVGRAAAQNWSGRRDLALSSLARARELEPGHSEAGRMEAGIRNGLRPTAGVFYDWTEDSDDYQVNALWAEATYAPHAQLSLVPFVNVVGIRRPQLRKIDETWIGVTAAARPATRLGFWGRLSILTDPLQGSDYTPLTADLSLEWIAHDRFRFGTTFNRFAILSFRTLPEKITGEAWGGFAEMRPDWLTRVRVSADYARYAPVSIPGADFDGNHRVNAWLTASREVWAPIRLRAGVTARYLDFHRFQDIGIWNPDRFWAAAATAEWNWGMRDVWSLNGGFEIGPAREGDGDWIFYGAYRMGFSRAVAAYFLELSAGHSEGNVDTWTGYDRTFAHVGLRRRF